PAGVGAPAHLAAAAAPFSHLWECGADSVSPMGATFALSPTGGNFASQPPWLLGAGRPRSGAEHPAVVQHQHPQRRVPAVRLSRGCGRRNIAIGGGEIRDRRDRWSQNCTLSPWAEKWKWRVSPAWPCALISFVGAGASEEHRHRWRRNAKSSPSVEQQLQFISMGGDVPVGEYRSRLCAMIAPDWGPGPEEHRHRWRRNAKSWPSVEQQLQFIPMGGDVPVDEHRPRLSAMIVPDWGPVPEAHRHRWRRNAKSSPSVEQQPSFVSIGV